MDNFIIDDGLDQEEEVRMYVRVGVLFEGVHHIAAHTAARTLCVCLCVCEFDDTAVNVR